MRRELYVGVLARGLLLATSGLGCLRTPMGTGEVDAFLQGLEESLKALKRQCL